jgi:hypothetical protein
MMHVIDVVLDSFSNLFRSHRYSPVEKLYSVFLFTAGLSLRDLSERLCLTGASRESVRIWVHRFSSLFRPSRRVSPKGSLTYPPGSNPPVMVVGEFGKGRVVYTSEFVVVVANLCDNLKLAINIFKWLSQRGTYDITVLVKGAAGQPIQGALVELIRGGTTIARTKTDDSGRAVFSRVVGSDYIVKATYEQFSSTASLPKGTRSTTVTLDIKQTTTIRKEETITSLIIGMIIGAVLGVTMVLIAVWASRRRRTPVDTVLYQPSECLPSIPVGDISTTSQT